MMATEATSENFADATTIVETEQTTTTTSQDVASEIPRINGELKSDDTKLFTELLEPNVHSAEVSVSGGSDTEATKAEAETAKTQSDEKGHTRSTSTVKKFTSFKAVSVNKTFLAAKGSTPAKMGDKGAAGSASLPAAPLTSSAPRPRLVAKSGSGLRDSAPRTATAPNGGKLGAAPDASAVWNKNRPAPPPEQKRITDEELKQQYGIHLATRLQSDDPGRQANWADIDDDDDDWAPESIEWTDGTKITLPQADEVVSVLAKPAAPPLVNDTINTETPKPISPTPSSSTPSTVKLGGISTSSGRGLVLKGAAEKPTLVAKPPGPPTPVKSPWAPLPPVEKVPPIAADVQQQQQSSARFSQRDPHGFENMQPPPAKEIAADDFSRTWRDAGTSSNRELFNSQSGRYEPVNDSRRGAGRGDGHARQLALLQRPSQQDQQGPAEPSPAFQTHRATGQDGGYGRRRASSTVSGGSGNFARRMSKGQETHPSHEILDGRRGSLVAVSDPPVSPNNVSSSLHQPGSRGHPQQQRQSRASPSISHASPTSAHGQMVSSGGSQTAIQIEDEVELQKKIMRESRELARKRRLEEEAREEAERKERIRLKLEAMGPAPESKKSRKEAPKEEKAAPPQIQTRDGLTRSPPKPPVPEAAGEIKQYGLMKVHPPDSIIAEPKAGKSEEIRPAAQEILPNGVHPSSIAGENTEIQQISNDARQTPPWQNATPSGQDRYSSWVNPASHSTQGRNVWGPPTSDRTLGNGTFNPDLSRLPEIHNSQSSQHAASSPGPGPIGPPNSNRANGHYQERVREQYGQRPVPIGPPQRQQGLAREQQRAQANAAWNRLPEKLAQDDVRSREDQDKQDVARRELQTTGAESSAPQPVYKDTWKQVAVTDDGIRSGVKAVSQTVHDGTTSSMTPVWKDLAPQPSTEDITERMRFDQQDAGWRQMESPSGKPEISQPVYKDTWRHVQLENGVRGEILGSSTVANNASTSTASPAVRGSRFFPQSKDIRLEDPTVSFARPGSPSPPPPTMAGHPAYDGDIAHPQVSLPRPPPVVRLPPPRVLAPIGPPKPVTSFAAAAAAPVTPAVVPSNPPPFYQSRQQDENSRYKGNHVGPARLPHGPNSEGNWQDRINHLIGRRSSPPKTHALAVDSSSKHALEVPTPRMSATVSLPTSPSGNLSEDEDLFETKPMAEECFEEQEMGSLPPIRVPNKAPEAAWRLAAPQNKPLPRKFALAHVTTADTLAFLAQITNNGSTVHIFLPGMVEEKCVNIPPKREARQNSNGRRQGQPRVGAPRHTSSNHSRGGRSREPSSGFPSPGQEHSSVTPSPTPSSRGGVRGRGNFSSQWNNHRHVSTPPSAINV